MFSRRIILIGIVILMMAGIVEANPIPNSDFDYNLSGWETYAIGSSSWSWNSGMAYMALWSADSPAWINSSTFIVPNTNNTIEAYTFCGHAPEGRLVCEFQIWNNGTIIINDTLTSGVSFGAVVWRRDLSDYAGQSVKFRLVVSVVGDPSFGTGRNMVDYVKFLDLEGPELQNSSWPKFKQNRNNTGLSPYNSYSDGTVSWTYNTGEGIFSSPSIDSEGIIYIGSNDNKLYAVYPNGTLKWSYTTSGDVRSSPAIDSEGNVYFGGADGYVYSLYPGGTLKWSYNTGSWIESSPTITSDGTIYIGSDNGNLYSLYPDGILKWNYNTGGEIKSSPAIDSEGIIYIGSNDNKLYAVYPNGTGRWNFTSGGNIYSSPAIDTGGIIYFGSSDNKLYAIYPNGTEKWNFTVNNSGGLYASPSIGTDGTIYMLEDEHDGYLYAIYPNGTKKWQYLIYGSVYGAPVISNNDIIHVGSSGNGNVYALNSDGALSWSYATGGEIYSQLAINYDGVVYAAIYDGTIYAFTYTTYDPSGYVLNSEGSPIQDATVTFSNATFSTTAVTNPAGYYNFSYQIADGTYNFTAQKSGYVDTTGYGYFTNGGSEIVNITLYNVNINGTVYDASNGSVLSSVNISLYQNNHYANGTGRYFNTTSDANGTYSLQGFLIDKQIDVNATKAAYTHNDFNITPLQAGNYIMDLYLIPVCPGGNVCGLVLSWPWYQAIPDATVNLWNATYSNTTTTNEWGYYVFT